jgi:uncharacterized protein involved in exopolysaccharide biosynthesis
MAINRSEEKFALAPPTGLAVPGSAPPRAPSPENADLFDYVLIKDYLGYVAGSVRQHWFLCLTVFAAVVGLTGALLWALPKTYHAETKLLAQRNQVIAALGNPGRSMPWEADMPTRAASEIILRHDNLVAIAKQTNLTTRWAQSRAPLPRIMDLLAKHLRGGRPIAEDELLGAMVGTLETRLEVTTGEGTVTIRIDWPDARSAFDLVDAAQRNFLEARHVSEVSAISEALSILERRASSLRDEIEADVEQVEAAREALAKGKAVKSGRRSSAPVGPKRKNEASDFEVAELRGMIEAKRRAIADVEGLRRRQVEELQAKLAETRLTYADSHPAVIDLQQRIDTLQSQDESPQLRSIRQELQTLEGEAIRRGAFVPHDTRTGELELSRRLPTSAQQIARATTAEIEDAPIEQAKSDLRFAISKYQNILDRIDAAKMENETARAAFKYRYSVLMPAEVPRKPIKPKVATGMATGVIGGLFAAVFLATAWNLRKNLVRERWQVERLLELPVLGEVHL